MIQLVTTSILTLKKINMNTKLHKIAWCTCTMLTLLTSGWPIFDNGYLIAIWVLSAITSIILTDIVLNQNNDIDSDIQLNCGIICMLCMVLTLVSAIVAVWGWFLETNDDFVTLSKCILCALAPIGIITKNIASWKPK